MIDDIVIISGSASTNLVNEICKPIGDEAFGLRRVQTDVHSHNDKETFVEIMDNIRGGDV